MASLKAVAPQTTEKPLLCVLVNSRNFASTPPEA